MSMPYFAKLEVLLACLDLEALDEDLYLGDPGPGKGRLFGGMVAAQSAMAASQTVPADRPLHSLHAYFLRPGRHDAPLRFVVDRIRDGRTYTTRRVKAHQAGEAIFSLSASFAVPEEGIAHQDEMPAARDPATCEEWEDMRVRVTGDEGERRESPLEVRMVDPFPSTGPPATTSAEVRQRMWIRVKGELPDDARIRTAMLVYLTDRGLLSSLVQRYRTSSGNNMAASLDHAIWIHRPPSFLDWLLYDCTSPAAYGGRGICMGSLYDRHNGARIATVAQEGLLRLGT